MTGVVIAIVLAYVVAAKIVLWFVQRPHPEDEYVDDWPEDVTADDVRSLYGEWQIRRTDRLREEFR